jgi:hypothetical protein
VRSEARDWRRRVSDGIGRLARHNGCTLLSPPFLLEGKVQPLGKAAEGQRGATKRSVFLGQSCKFLATTRTVICHKERPLRSSRVFESDHIHTGHNARSCRSVRQVWISSTRSRG